MKLVDIKGGNFFLLALYIKKKTFALSIVMKITLSSMTMIIAHLPSSRNHYLEKRKWKMKIQYDKGLQGMSLSHDILSKFYLSSCVSWIVFIHYIFRSFLLNSLPYENVIYRDQSLLYSICSSGTPYIKRVKKLFKILAVIINDILKMSAPETIEPQWNECLYAYIASGDLQGTLISSDIYISSI